MLVVGSGPIGSYFAARLTEVGEDVTLHGLGTRFIAVAKAGVIRLADVDDPASARDIPLRCRIDPPDPEGWDVVIFAVKAHDLGIASRQFSTHATDAAVVLPQNGLPWWQFLGVDLPLRLATVDPGGTIESSLRLDSIAGCVISKGLSFDAQGTLVEAQVASDSFVLGDVLPGSRASATPAALFHAAALPTRVVSDIRTEKWKKLLINVAFNPLGALSHLRFGEVLDDEEGERLALALMSEAMEVARASGMTAEIDIETAFSRARSSRSHKTSMLQDVEAGRPLELEPILGVLIELARLTRCSVPTLETIYSCLRLLNLGLARGPIRQAQRVL